MCLAQRTQRAQRPQRHCMGAIVAVQSPYDGHRRGARLYRLVTWRPALSSPASCLQLAGNDVGGGMLRSSIGCCLGSRSSLGRCGSLGRRLGGRGRLGSCRRLGRRRRLGGRGGRGAGEHGVKVDWWQILA